MNETTILTNLRIWDGVGSSYLADANSVLIKNGIITKIWYLGEELFDKSNTYNCGGMTLLPGLIDAHIHLCLDPNLNNIVDQNSLVDSVKLQGQMEDRCRNMVYAGITSARDLGGGTWDEIVIRNRILKGEIAGPRLLCSGQPITSLKGHGYFWGGEAVDTNSAIKVIDRRIARGADLIKVMVTGGELTPGSDPLVPQFNVETLKDIVSYSLSKGLKVAAHCHGIKGINSAIMAGVSTIEHCSWMGSAEAGWGMEYDDSIAHKIASGGMWVSPTVNAGWKKHIGNMDFENRVRGGFRGMREAGIKFIASTDAGIPGVPHNQLPEALPVLAELAGLSVVETLRSATSDCADAIGLGLETGRIVEGLSADLVLVNGDILSNLSLLMRPVHVWARGVMVL